MKRMEVKFSEMYEELKTLAGIQIKDKDELTTKFTDVSQALFGGLNKTKILCDISDSKVESLKLTTELTSNSILQNEQITYKLEKHLNQFKEDLMVVETHKADKDDIEYQYKRFTQAIEDLDRSGGIFDNRIKYVENFIDKYMPIQMQALITDSIYTITQDDVQNKRYKRHLLTQMVI
jgi:predicted amino acid-binding ACT domain protein